MILVKDIMQQESTANTMAGGSSSIRPMPRNISLNGRKFILCRRGPRCVGEKCTFAHSKEERNAWNRQLIQERSASSSDTGRSSHDHERLPPQPTFASIVKSPRPLAERRVAQQALKLSKSTDQKFPIEAAVPCHKSAQLVYHRCMYDDLRRHNYQKKFSELIKCEQVTHKRILDAKCSSNCLLKIDKSGSESDSKSEEIYKLHGELSGLSDDQIAYVSQSADQREGVIIMAKNRMNEVCRAAILRQNYTHTDNKLYIAFDEQNETKLRERFKNIFEQGDCKGVAVHVKFKLKYSYFKNLSQSIWRIPQDIIAKIMPDSQSLCQFECLDLDFDKYLPKGSFSNDQTKALKMIVSSPSNGPPSLITGPFGTGKSHLLAAAAYWLFRNSRDTKKPVRILVCTQQRESADNFFLLYHGLMSHEEDAKVFIVRQYGYQNRKLKRWYKSVDGFKTYLDEIDSKNTNNVLVIMPCLTALHVSKKEFLPPDFFTHIFVDEGSQMREPEALAPLTMASKDTKIVIAGDPWQVGPSTLVLGEDAQKYGLATSLLERLLQTYQSHALSSNFSKMISLLDHCHRCHKEILSLSSRLFYDTELKIPENEQSMEHPKYPYPLLFVCSNIDEEKTSKSTKNENEAKVIIDYAEDIAANWSKHAWGGQYHLDMCVMSPTRAQLTVIYEHIKSDKYSSKLLEVRRVPTFFMQGKEYKVLLLSTSEPITEKGASANPTKSLCNPYVFNTAITRAQSLVVSFGNPFQLLKMEQNVVKRPGYEKIGKCWSNYFKCCLEKGTLKFHDSLKLSEDRRDEILMKITTLVERQLQEKVQYPPHMDVQEETESVTTLLSEATAPPISSENLLSTSLLSKTLGESESIELMSQEDTSRPPEQHISSDADSTITERTSSTPISEFESKYTLEGSLGGGGFGVVFRVKYSLDKHEYALKVIPLPEEDTKQERLLREVVALAHYDHAHIVRYYHSWKERAPENWQDKQGWQGMRSRFLSFAKRISSSNSTSTQMAAVHCHASTSVNQSGSDSIVTFRSNSVIPRAENVPSPSTNVSSSIAESAAIVTSSPSQTVSSSLSVSSQTLINLLCQSPPTCLFIRMELCKNETLRDWLSAHSKENTRKKKDVVEFFEQMLSALSYIHEKNHIHRDLKPSNIFFSVEDGRLKVGDFGLVTTDLSNDLTVLYSERKYHYQAGTPTYASPEQLRKESCYPESDIYTLGLICFELHYICKTTSERIKLFLDLRKSRRFPQEFPKRVYKEVTDVIKSMIAEQPSERPSAIEILQGEQLKEIKLKVNRKKATKQPYIPVI